jgi:uncharacterized protein (DUF433 family)
VGFSFVVVRSSFSVANRAEKAARWRAGPTFRTWIGLSDNIGVAQAITKDPETMHGTPVFRGTRVPVQTLFEYLVGGDTLEDFLEGFPTVSRALAVEALEEAKQLLLART